MAVLLLLRKGNMSEQIKVLDNGYVELVETWGSDERVIESARMSTLGGFKGWGPKEDGKPGDEKLLRYLWENHHATPFEMAGLTIEVQAPLFVFREWHRHRSQSYNEASARYSPIPDVNYFPTIERVVSGGAATKNKQAGGIAAKPIDDIAASGWLNSVTELYSHVEAVYQRGLALGVPKELARIVMPVGRYSRMRASANLRNWLGFLTLRQDQAAQYEIRCYANIVADLLTKAFPRTMELFNEGLEK